MKNINRFSVREWLQLKPLTQALKQLRNDAQLALYLRKSMPLEEEFLSQIAHLRAGNILVVIAFEQPLALHWLLQQTRRHISDFTVIVLDNSRSNEARNVIRSVCLAQNTPYLGLPPNHTRHVNRSHALAMCWAYEHVVRKVCPDIFGFIDHDMIPVAPNMLASHLREQPCYGLINAGDDCWNLWAGYCLFRYDAVRNRKLNFLYDFSRGLDTGGRNWSPLYSTLDFSKLAFADNEYNEIRNPDNGQTRVVQVVDRTWLHIGGIGYNNNFAEKGNFFIEYLRAIGVESPAALLKQSPPQ